MSIAIEKNKNPQGETAKHTPGPWKVWHGSRSVFAHNEHIADIYLPEPRKGENGIARTPELIANAKLIAAAPELLDVARFALGFVSRHYSKADGQNLKIALEETIRKATGE